MYPSMVYNCVDQVGPECRDLPVSAGFKGVPECSRFLEAYLVIRWMGWEI